MRPAHGLGSARSWHATRAVAASRRDERTGRRTATVVCERDGRLSRLAHAPVTARVFGARGADGGRGRPVRADPVGASSGRLVALPTAEHAQHGARVAARAACAGPAAAVAAVVGEPERLARSATASRDARPAAGASAGAGSGSTHGRVSGPRPSSAAAPSAERHGDSATAHGRRVRSRVVAEDWRGAASDAAAAGHATAASADGARTATNSVRRQLFDGVDIAATLPTMAGRRSSDCCRTAACSTQR